ncbi:MAG TPA: hypothetical protein VFB62_27815 [Polyangiaceae bacterium]|jgi:hypothetical protein|nr:hypothetical protein [Polyangiaceae bacterium]
MRLDENASGLRHLRWAREIHAALHAHLELGRGSPEERGVWAEEAERLGTAIAAAREPVKIYRDFLERVRVKSRGALRAAELGTEDDRVRAQSAHEALELGPRAKLKREVREAVKSLRREVDSVLSRIEKCSGTVLVHNVLPPLTPDRQRVVDVQDDDDDATAAS